MQFNKNAIENKIKHLDEIKFYPELLQKFLEKHLGVNATIKELPRRWTGGGATLYLIEYDQKKAFLKIKHQDVTVESKLEEEEAFIQESCLFHEYTMLQKARNAGVSVPDVIFYDKAEGFELLATEHIPFSLENALQHGDVVHILNLWNSLLNNIRKLFNAGMVHSDIHEYNIRCKSLDEVVLIDFEECRDFKQNCIFEDSLDYVGTNGKSSLGDFPLCNEQKFSIHINCLLRMKQVFKEYVAEKTKQYLNECNYDSSNGICTSLDHGKSEKTYQPIKNNFFEVDGQRNGEDKRPEIINSICDELLKNQKYTFIDIGSNNGLFCREHSKHTNGTSKSIGLEGFQKFNVLARALALLDDCENIEYCDFLCGEDDLQTLNINEPCFVSICSVWHHIQKKQTFLEQLRQLDVLYVFLEMAVQEECYESRSWEKEVENIKTILAFSDSMILGYSSDYQRPMILISKNQLTIAQKKRLEKIIKKMLQKSFWQHLGNFIHGK